MLFFYHKTAEQDTFTKIEAPTDGSWIVAEKASTTDLEYICKLTGIHIADICDSLDYHEIPRIEEFQNQLLLFIRYPTPQEGHHHTVPLTILLLPPYFITITPTKTSLLHQILERKDITSIYKPSDFLLQILFLVAQEFNGEIRKARYSFMAQKKEMYKVNSEDISFLTEQEEILNQYLASLEPMQLVLENLGRSDKRFLQPKTHHDLDDVINSIKQSKTLCEMLIKNIRNLRDSYQIVFANNLTRTIKLLTALTIIFSIPNMIASIYGMNVQLPLADSVHAFPLLLLSMLVSSLFCGYWFYRKNWM